jgi:transcriptional regulator of heat shock response
MTFEATIRFDDTDMNDVIERIVKEAIFEDSSFANTIAGEIDVDDVAQVVADNTDWDDISDAIHDKIRENNLEEIATYLSGDISDTLMEGSQFADLVEMKIEKAIDEDLKNRLEQMNNTINSQAIAISQLTKGMNAMQSKKFWKKLLKGK